MSKLLAGFITLLATTSVMAGDKTNWPLQGADESAPMVVAAYTEQCEKWAENQPADNRDAFMKGCLENIKATWPVGPDNKISD